LSAQASASERSGTQGFQEGASLELGKPIERELSGGLSHFYKITMTHGQFLRIVVKQLGIDVTAVISTPDGKKIGLFGNCRESPQHLVVNSISRKNHGFNGSKTDFHGLIRPDLS
jgi:hypothetical protein